jgi:hypothetical protein
MEQRNTTTNNARYQKSSLHIITQQRSQIKEYLSTMSLSTPCLWVQLVIEEKNIGTIVKIRPIPEDISDVKNEFFKLKKTSLQHCDAATLTINHGGNTLPPNQLCSEISNVTAQNPLIMVAPPAEKGKFDLEIFVLILALLVSWRLHTKYFV